MDHRKIYADFSYFGQLLRCGAKIYSWTYSPELELLSCNCPDPDSYAAFFSLGGCLSRLTSYCQKQPLPQSPVVLSDSLGLSWIADFLLQNGNLQSVYLIGPTFTSEISSWQIEHMLRQKQLSDSLVRQFQKQTRQIPLTPLTTLLQYGLMLHFSITEQEISISDFHYQASEPAAEDFFSHNETLTQDPSQETAVGEMTYLAETASMKAIEDGNLNYQQSFDKLATDSYAMMPLRRLKNFLISYITLATRASIRGGLDVETAYAVGNYYADACENTNNISELMRINTTMYNDFVQRVHKAKSSSGLSPVLLQCRNYIDLHLNEDISVRTVAQKMGYSASYLSQKFRQEMGIPLNKYIRRQRIEQACTLLKNTSRPIQDISESLCFCNPSYFCEAFRAQMGCTPLEYRNR